MSLDYDVRKSQKDHFSQEKTAHVSFDNDDSEKYVEKVEKEFHKRRRETWWDNYKINYRNRHKDQKKARKNNVD